MKIQELSGYGVSKSIVDKLVDLGYISLLEIQELAVKARLFENKNLVISAPTNSGNTFIGELAALNASKRGSGKELFI